MNKNRLDDIVSVNLDYLAPCIVETDHDTFFEKLKSLPEGWLEQNKTFALLFDGEADINKVKNYLEIVDYFKDSLDGNRVFGKSIYIGNFKPEDHEVIINQVLSIYRLKRVEFPFNGG